jgi:hypothetical protein
MEKLRNKKSKRTKKTRGPKERRHKRHPPTQGLFGTQEFHKNYIGIS